jgi:hypothetical protein
MPLLSATNDQVTREKYEAVYTIGEGVPLQKHDTNQVRRQALKPERDSLLRIKDEVDYTGSINSVFI